MAGMIAHLRQLGGLVEEAAPAIAAAVDDELQLQIAAARTPTNAPWRPRKEDGGQALQGAGKALTVKVVGTVILARLEGVYARHHLGAVRGKVRRQILPTSGIPTGIERGIRIALDRKFAELAGGAVR